MAPARIDIESSFSTGQPPVFGNWTWDAGTFLDLQVRTGAASRLLAVTSFAAAFATKRDVRWTTGPGTAGFALRTGQPGAVPRVARPIAPPAVVSGAPPSPPPL